MAQKKLSNPFSTGDGGGNFENDVQASFLVLMLTKGFSPCFNSGYIHQIQFQGKYAGFNTDDLIVYIKNNTENSEYKFLAQIKHKIKITSKDKTFAEVIAAAWLDFNNPQIFTKGKDKIALITGPLSQTDTYDVRTILEFARHSANSKDFFTKMELSNFCSNKKRAKLKAFKDNIIKVSKKKIEDEDFFQFLRHFYLLGYDLDIKLGVTKSLLQSIIGQYSTDKISFIWSGLVDEVRTFNQNAGVITNENISEEIKNIFKKKDIEEIPDEFVSKQKTKKEIRQQEFNYDNINTFSVASILGSWNENNKNDMKIVRRLSDGF